MAMNDIVLTLSRDDVFEIIAQLTEVKYGQPPLGMDKDDWRQHIGNIQDKIRKQLAEQTHGKGI